MIYLLTNCLILFFLDHFQLLGFGLSEQVAERLVGVGSVMHMQKDTGEVERETTGALVWLNWLRLPPEALPPFEGHNPVVDVQQEILALVSQLS